MRKRNEIEFEVMVLLGIIKQLMTTQQTRLLKKHAISLSQYSLLTHFYRHPDKLWTITRLSSVMEINQPGITKICNYLLERELIHSHIDKHDRRVRYMTITKQGINLYEQLSKLLQPFIHEVFNSWEAEELDSFKAHLQKLMKWLDQHR